MKIGILIDSGASLDETLLKDTNIHSIPLHVIMSDGTDLLDLPEILEKNNVFDKLNDKEQISTSMASPGELMQKYDDMLENFEHILHLTITPNLSGMNQTARMVVNSDEYRNKVTIIEHNLAANGITYLARTLDKMIKSGETDINKFQEFSKSMDDKVFLGLIPGDIVKLSKGGRTKSLLLSFLKMWKTKILIKWGEKPTKLGMARTFSAIVEKSFKEIENISGKNPKIILVYSLKTSQKTIDSIRKALDGENIDYEIQYIPSIYACHAGVETTGIIAIPKELL